jgi:hypothetical protein
MAITILIRLNLSHIPQINITIFPRILRANFLVVYIKTMKALITIIMILLPSLEGAFTKIEDYLYIGIKAVIQTQ